MLEVDFSTLSDWVVQDIIQLDFSCSSKHDEIRISNLIQWHLALFKQKKLIFDLSWPLPTLDDFVSWKIIHDWKLHEKSCWMTPCTTQTEKVEFLTSWPWRWPRMTLYDGKSYISEIYMKNQDEWHPAQLNLMKLIFDLSWTLISISYL